MSSLVVSPRLALGAYPERRTPIPGTLDRAGQLASRWLTETFRRRGLKTDRFVARVTEHEQPL